MDAAPTPLSGVPRIYSRCVSPMTAAKARKHAAHGVSRGSAARRGLALAGRRKPDPRSRACDVRLIPAILDEESHAGDDVAGTRLEALQGNGRQLRPVDVLVIK